LNSPQESPEKKREIMIRLVDNLQLLIHKIIHALVSKSLRNITVATLAISLTLLFGQNITASSIKLWLKTCIKLFHPYNVYGLEFKKVTVSLSEPISR
jgi:hypothetical protein